MQSSLAKSLYVGLAALSFGAVTTVSTTANAARKAKVTSSQSLKTAPETRNVEVTGTNALYSKPGTVKGAKVVASKKTMKKLATSKKSADYFRAYYQKVTNKGSVYYKIVSMNGKYRGYIYGGKKEGTFAGGIATANTTTKANMPANTTVYFAKPGKANVTWDAPKYTQYKASKQIKNTSAYASDPLTVTDAATKTREGSLYYYVKDAKNPAISGWIYAGAVTAAKSDTAKAENGITFNFVNKANGAKVSSAVYEFPTGDTLSQADAYKQAKTLVPAGYSIAGTDAASSFGTTTTKSYAKNSSETVYVNENNAITLGTDLKVYNADMNEAQSSLAFPADVVTKIQADGFFKQANGLTAKAADIETHLKADGAGEFTVVTKTSNGKGGFVAYKYSLNYATDGVFGGAKSTVYYNVTKGSVTTSTSNGNFVAN